MGACGSKDATVVAETTDIPQERSIEKQKEPEKTVTAPAESSDDLGYEAMVSSSLSFSCFSCWLFELFLSAIFCIYTNGTK
jgi:hypothetical protein